MSVTLPYTEIIKWDTEIIPNFQLWEAACKCGCGLVILDPELLAALWEVRVEFGEPVTATSWCRCPDHNRNEGGKPDSYHPCGKAVDLKPARGRMFDRFIELCRKHFPFVIVYATFCHCDMRGNRGIGEAL